MYLDGHLSGEQRQRLVNLLTTVVMKEIGKGPTEVKVMDRGTTITVKISGILCPLEKKMMTLGRPDLVTKIREVLWEGSAPEWRDLLGRELGLDIGAVTGQIDLEQDCRTVELHLQQTRLGESTVAQ